MKNAPPGGSDGARGDLFQLPPNLSQEGLASKAAELGIALDAAQSVADELGLSLSDALRKIDLAQSGLIDDGLADAETGAAAAASAIQERRETADRGRDRAERVRVAGFQRKKFDHEDGQERAMMVRKAPIIARALTEPERKMLGQVELFVRWCRAQEPSGFTEAMVERLQSLHSALGWDSERQSEHLLHIACTIALMYRQAGNRPPPHVANTGALIVENVGATIRRANGQEPPWLAGIAAGLDDVLDRTTLARGGGGRQNIGAALAELIASAKH